MQTTTTSSTHLRPKIGIGIVILDDEDRILMSRRKDCNLYGIPGGLLERYE